jgi:gamma-glutamylcyclotransferase (GGCT)/AIG2-like uncharacterized protein YtfP
MQILFVYGTLRPGHAPREIAAAVDQCTVIGIGTVRAHLYDLGNYPGIALDDTAPAVPGIILQLPEDATVLTQLDAYEGFYPNDPATSLFLRVTTTVTLADGSTTTCWVYVYNR